MRIGILQTDHVRAQFVIQHGDYGDMFAQLLKAQDPDLDLITYDVQVSCPEEIICDAYLITGSKDSVYDNLPWIEELVGFLRRVLAADKKVIGICFGHQLMAHFFGGRVAPAPQGASLAQEALAEGSSRRCAGAPRVRDRTVDARARKVSYASVER